MRLCDDSADNKYSVADTTLFPSSHCPIVPLKTKESAEG